MVMRRWRTVLAIVFGLGVARPARAHPLHTTLAEVAIDQARGTVRVTIRMFSDDLANALAKRGGSRTDAVATAYVSSAFSLLLSSHALPLQSCGTTRRGDLIWFCLEAQMTTPTAGLSARDTLFCDAYTDQVNIVQVAALGPRGSPRSTLFVRGDGAKRLL